MGEFGMRWRISVCLHFLKYTWDSNNKFGLALPWPKTPMVYIRSHGEEIPLGSRHTDKQTISFLN